MKIAFIRPSMFGKCSKDVMYPLVFAIVKALTPKNIDIAFYDEKAEKLPLNINADVIALSVETFSAKRAYKLAEQYGKQGKIIIMGGFHPSLCPDEALNYCNSVIIGEIEEVWANVLDDLKNGCLNKIYKSDKLTDLSAIKYDYSVFKGKKYNKIGLIQFSRGCRYSCEFCSVHAFFKNSIRTKPIELIINELKQIKENILFFIDDNLFADEKEAERLFNGMISLKKKWACQISIDAAKNIQMLKLMKKAGCFLVLIGFESLNADNLKQMNKSANVKYNDYNAIIQNIQNAGIMIYGTFVIGYDNDTKETAKNLMNYALKNKFAIANFNPLMPMPGTKLYERLKNENRLVYDKWWLDDNYTYGSAMFKPLSMTEDELMQSCKEARYEFNSYKNIFGRLLNFKSNCATLTNLILFLTANLISKSEIYAKQGKKLGGEQQYENSINKTCDRN